MGGAIVRWLDSLMDHYLVACVFLAQLIMTVIGVGNVRTVSMLGLLLCAAGLARSSAQVDPWVLAPLILYNLFSILSTAAAYGNITEGYGSLQSVFPVLYLLMACLSERELLALKELCAIWAGAVALCGVVQFVWRAAAGNQTGRLSGFLGNPNAMGIFLVIGWFALMSCRQKGEDRRDRALSLLEPLLLAALALTLSMGSFVAMAAGILVLLAERKGSASWQETFRCACVLLAKAGLGIGTGVLIYLAATRTGAPWICLLLLLYGGAEAVLWRDYERFLQARPWMAALISALGAAVAVTVVLIRPSAIATFAERLEMMESAVRYLTVNPLFGVGPYRWRFLDLQDGGTYFNTWHIHNALLHVGVEMGWAAMAMLIAVVVRFYQKRPDAPEKAGITAFFLHNLMDTSFFYMGITSLALMTAKGSGGKKLTGLALKAVFGLFAAMFAWNLYQAAAAV